MTPVPRITSNGRRLITAADDDLEYRAFGIRTQFPDTEDDPAPGDRLDAGAAGELTETLPGGSATATGQSVGIESDGTDIRLTRSDIPITTDFSGNTVTSSATLAQSVYDIDNAPVVSASNLDFTAAGSMTGAPADLRPGSSPRHRSGLLPGCGLAARAPSAPASRDSAGRIGRTRR